MISKMKRLIAGLMPPIIMEGVSILNRRRKKTVRPRGSLAPSCQELDVYWNNEFADTLGSWGRGNAWDEIQFMMAGRQGRVLDVACGTGVNMLDLSKWPGLEVHGCDISDLLIGRARKQGIPADRLTVCDASKMPYPDAFFDYGYSIGSLEHFDVASMEACIRECQRVVRGAVFHMVPVSNRNENEGWIRRQQSFHNNSEEWWRERFSVAYDTVLTLDSRWNDDISVGKWFVCIRGGCV